MFTAQGRYFFFRDATKEATWVPAAELAAAITGLPADAQQALFDPAADEGTRRDHGGAPGAGEETLSMGEDTPSTEEDMPSVDDQDAAEDALAYEIDEEAYEAEAAEEAPREQRPARDPEQAAAAHTAAVAAFTAMLRERAIDPFQPWDRIAEGLRDEPAFATVGSAKERAALFAALCPELVEGARAGRQARLKEAQEAWAAKLASLTDAARLPATWTEFSRTLKRTAPWFKLLEPKTMEREYRARLQELRTRAIVYNVRS